MYRYAHEVAQLFRSLVDEPDKTFLGDIEVASYLSQGYADFRRIVTTQNPDIYEDQMTLQVTGSSLNLDGILFGATPVSGSAQRISRVEVVDGSGQFQCLLTPAASVEQQQPLYNWRNTWYVQKRRMLFANSVDNILRITYLPEPDINWTTGIVSGSNIYIDDLIQFHDIIALLAMKFYYIKDFSANPQYEQKLAQRIADLREFLTKGRNGDSFRWVVDESSYVL